MIFAYWGDFMKYTGMPQAMWIMFESSFKKQLNHVFGYDKNVSQSIMKKAKFKYNEIISMVNCSL